MKENKTKRTFGQLGEIVYKQKKCIKEQCCFILLIHFFLFYNTVNLLLEKRTISFNNLISLIIHPTTGTPHCSLYVSYGRG